MNQKIKISEAIKYVIIGIALFVFLLIWPLGVIEKTEVSKSNEIQLQESGPISVMHNGTQMFVAEGKNIKAVDLYVLNDMQNETITFRLYDGEYKQLFHILFSDQQYFFLLLLYTKTKNLSRAISKKREAARLLSDFLIFTFSNFFHKFDADKSKRR